MLDLKMPRMDGAQVLRQIKADEQMRLIPVVVLTSSRESLDLQACYQLGVNAYVVNRSGLSNSSVPYSKPVCSGR
jgi:CheY-like chemotaxis protein